jgi:uracil-DNA glycosylase
MNVTIHESWKSRLQSEFEKPYFESLTEFLRSEYKNHTCYPKGSRIFAAFNYCTFQNTRVVIIGQDPYHGPGQANGLCFSVYNGIPHPPSLVNIFKELEHDLKVPYPTNGDLERWAKQGVLLLNATLTVRAHNAGSHQNKGWETFTDAVIRIISNEKQGVVFMLWGGYAKKKGVVVNKQNHHVLTSGHPSPLSANRGYWFGNKHFSTCNKILEKQGEEPIKW